MLEKLKIVWDRLKYIAAAVIFSLGLAFIIFKKGINGDTLGHYFRDEHSLNEEAERKRKEADRKSTRLNSSHRT